MGESDDRAELARRVAALEAELASVRSSHATLEAMVESVPDFVVRVTVDGVFEYVNRFFPGISRDQIIGRSAFEFTAPDEHDRVRAALRRVVATGEPTSYETTGLNAAGLPTPYFTRVAPIIENGRVVGLTSVATDVSEVKEMARSLADHRDRLELAAAAANIGYWHWDARSDVVRWDPTSCRHFGVPPEAGRTTYQGFLDRLHPEDRGRIRSEVDESVVRGHYKGLQFRTVTPAGELRWLMTAGRVERDEHGVVSGLLGCLIDVTERRRLEEHLLQAQRLDAVGQLAAGVAHNFNNLLAALIPALEMTARTAPDGAPLLRELQGSAQRAADVVRQLTAFAGGRPRESAQTTDAAEIARRVVELARGVLDRAITIDLVVPAEPALARVDSGELEHALMNLVLNARDALEDVIAKGRPARILVGVSVAAGPPARVEVHVTDTGAGMTEEVRRRSIEPFFTTKGPGRGTGLGLSSTYAMVTAHGGELDIDSIAGGGTTISMRLPAATAVSASAKLPDDSALGGSETVLLVDDDDAVRRTIASVLRAAGYHIRDFGDPLEALAVFSDDPAAFDVAIVDHSMPGLSGQALLDRMRAVAPTVRAISFSGHDVPLQGARAQLAKPVSINVLLAALRRVLDAP